MPLRLIQFSDIHFGCEDTAALAAATDYLAGAAFDLLLITGDITQYGHHDEFAAAGRWMARLPSPRIATPGNHDTPWFGLGERLVDPFRRYERAIGPAERDRFDGPGLAVRTLNSARGWQIRLNWSKGEVTKLMWEYITRHQLQDPVKRTDINADELLRAVVADPKVSMFELIKRVNSCCIPYAK